MSIFTIKKPRPLTTEDIKSMGFTRTDSYNKTIYRWDMPINIKDSGCILLGAAYIIPYDYYINEVNIKNRLFVEWQKSVLDRAYPTYPCIFISEPLSTNINLLLSWQNALDEIQKKFKDTVRVLAGKDVKISSRIRYIGF